MFGNVFRPQIQRFHRLVSAQSAGNNTCWSSIVFEHLVHLGALPSSSIHELCSAGAGGRLIGGYEMQLDFSHCFGAHPIVIESGGSASLHHRLPSDCPSGTLCRFGDTQKNVSPRICTEIKGLMY